MFACKSELAGMTAEEVFEFVMNGGASDFAAAVGIFDRFGPWCLIGGLAVNCYAEPVYTVDAEIGVVAHEIESVRSALVEADFRVEQFPPSINARRPGSKLSVQLMTGPRYEAFVGRAARREVLGQEIPVAALEDLVQGKIWAWQDQGRRLTKRKKDELDLLRLAEAYPHLTSSMPD